VSTSVQLGIQIPPNLKAYGLYLAVLIDKFNTCGKTFKHQEAAEIPGISGRAMDNYHWMPIWLMEDRFAANFGQKIL
jgi:hypothetical protein